ncbi:permease, partial [Bacillus cereus]
ILYLIVIKVSSNCFILEVHSKDYSA